MAMTDSSPVFIDTNVLIYANLVRSPFRLPAMRRLTSPGQRGVDLWISRQVLREYLAGMTRTSDLTGTIPIASLVGDVRYFAGRLLVAEDGPRVTERLLALVEQVPVAGKQIHDANVVATMQAHGIRQLLTHNADDFARFSHLITVLPLAGG